MEADGALRLKLTSFSPDLNVFVVLNISLLFDIIYPIVLGSSQFVHSDLTPSDEEVKDICPY